MKSKIKILAGLVLALFISAFSFQSQQSLEDENQSLLWKIEGNGLKNPSYLFGTMHLIQKDYFYFPVSLEKIIKKSDVILSEIALDKVSDQQEALKYIYLKEGNLIDFFNPQQQDSLFIWANKKLMMKKEAFLISFNRMKPFVIVQTVIQMNFMGKTESFEMKIKEVADKNKIPFDGFESLAEQIAFFDNLSKEKQAMMVMESIRDEEKNIALLNSMQGVYKRQKLDSLYAMIHQEGGIIADEQEVFLDKRNRTWIPKIKETISSKKTFIAVGAGHLAGGKGLIELLRKEGYKLTPIPY